MRSGLPVRVAVERNVLPGNLHSSPAPRRVILELLRRWLAGAWILVGSVVGAANDLDIDRRLLADRLVADRAQALAAQQKRADERQQVLFSELARRDRTLRDAQRREADALSQLQQVRAEQPALDRTRKELASATERLAANTQERLRLAGEIELRDRNYQVELAEYRRVITGAVATPNPQRLAALQRFADGERAQAFEALEEIDLIARETRRKVAQRVADLESAKETRERAALVMQMRDRGEKDTRAVRAIWAEALELDPDDFGSWRQLWAAEMATGDLSAAKRAADRALATATSDFERADALYMRAEMQQVVGDLRGAVQTHDELRKLYLRAMDEKPESAAGAVNEIMHAVRSGALLKQEAGELILAMRDFETLVSLARRVAEANPGSAGSNHAWRMVQTDLLLLGSTKETAGDFKGAQQTFDQSLEIARRLAAANPGSAAAQRQVLNSLLAVGRARSESGDPAGALAGLSEGVQIARRLAAADLSSADAARALAAGLLDLGRAQRLAGDPNGARRSFDESHQLLLRLAGSKPGSAEAQRDLLISLQRIGGARAAGGDRAGARQTLEDGVQLARRLSAANPGSADSLRDLSVSLGMFGHLQIQSEDWAGARQNLEEALQIARHLAAQTPYSASAQRDIAIAMGRLALVPDSPVRWSGVADQWQVVRERGSLRAADADVVKDVERRAAAQR